VLEVEDFEAAAIHSTFADFDQSTYLHSATIIIGQMYSFVDCYSQNSVIKAYYCAGFDGSCS